MAAMPSISTTRGPAQHPGADRLLLGASALFDPLSQPLFTQCREPAPGEPPAERQPPGTRHHALCSGHWARWARPWARLPRYAVVTIARPRQVYEQHIGELQQLLLRHDATILGLPNSDARDKARLATVTASSEARHGVTRLERLAAPGSGARRDAVGLGSRAARGQGLSGQSSRARLAGSR